MILELNARQVAAGGNDQMQLKTGGTVGMQKICLFVNHRNLQQGKPQCT